MGSGLCVTPTQSSEGRLYFRRYQPTRRQVAIEGAAKFIENKVSATVSEPALTLSLVLPRDLTDGAVEVMRELTIRQPRAEQRP